MACAASGTSSTNRVTSQSRSRSSPVTFSPSRRRIRSCWACFRVLGGAGGGLAAAGDARGVSCEPPADGFGVAHLGFCGWGHATRNKAGSGLSYGKSCTRRLRDRGLLGHVLGDLPATVDLCLVPLAIALGGQPPRTHRLEDGGLATRTGGLGCGRQPGHVAVDLGRGTGGAARQAPCQAACQATRQPPSRRPRDRRRGGRRQPGPSGRSDRLRSCGPGLPVRRPVPSRSPLESRRHAQRAR